MKTRIALILVLLVFSFGAPAKAEGKIYVVAEGDTLWGISRGYGTTVYALMEANDLGTDLIIPGQELSIPDEKADSGMLGREDLQLVARVIHAEARGESFLGKVAVGAVIINRLRHPAFPKTVRDVVF